jgi:hypothetical protein
LPEQNKLFSHFVNLQRPCPYIYLDSPGREYANNRVHPGYFGQMFSNFLIRPAFAPVFSKPEEKYVDIHISSSVKAYL